MATVARKAWRRLWRKGAAGLAVFALAVALVAAIHARLDTWDDAALRLERSYRLAQSALGVALPGTPDLKQLDQRLAARGLSLGAPIFVRIFKREFEFELWMKGKDGFQLFATYPICYWSGRLGPKLTEGDRQAPEGFYTVESGQLNPHSRWHRAFNLGFPNLYDRTHERTGSFVMVHGGCSSVGCYAMTNPVIDEIWRIVTAALSKGQRRFQVHVFPFRMTEQNIALRAGDPAMPYWRTLRPAYDLFEKTSIPPQVRVCNGRYEVTPGTAGSDAATALTNGCAEPSAAM